MMLGIAADSCRLRERLAVGLGHVKDVHAAESEDGLGSVGLLLALGLVLLRADANWGMITMPFLT